MRLGNGTGNASTNLLWIIRCMVYVDMWRSPLGHPLVEKEPRNNLHKKQKLITQGYFKLLRRDFGHSPRVCKSQSESIATQVIFR